MIVLHVVAQGDEPERAEAEIQEIVESAIDSMDDIDIRIVPERTYWDRPTGRTAQNILETADNLDPEYIGHRLSQAHSHRQSIAWEGRGESPDVA